MRVFILTGGSHGDLHPFLAIGRAAVARGHAVLLANNPYFAADVEAAGLAFTPVGTVAAFEQALKHEHLMHPLKGGRVVLDMIFQEMPAAIATCRREIERWQPDVVLSHHICMGVRWLCAELRLPLALAVLAPTAWLSRRDPVPITQRLPGRAWTAVGRVTDRLLEPMVGWLGDRLMNRVRRQIGMPPERGAFMAHCRGGDRNLALWSPLFRGPVADDPPQGVICGFAWYDQSDPTAALAPELEEFLAAGESPIVFSLGTAAVHAPGDFYRLASRACVELGRRGLLLTGRGLPPPAPLPSGVRAFDYAPFSLLLPRATATVHHGGIGSTAQSLRAGRPVLVVPHAHDQFHNALHACRLGVAKMVARHRLSVPRMVRALRMLLEDPAHAARAAALGRGLSEEDGAAVAVSELEKMGPVADPAVQRRLSTSP